MITGIGAITPLGLTAESSLENLVRGVSGIEAITRIDTSTLPTRIGAEVRGFAPKEYMSHRIARRSSRAAQMAVAAATQALQDAGLQVATPDPLSVGVVINTAYTGAAVAEHAALKLDAGGSRAVGPFLAHMALPSTIACQVAIALGAKGPVLTSVLACSGGAYAVVQGMQMIQRGSAGVVLVGGSEASITRLVVSALSNSGALSKYKGRPSEASRPFDPNRDGFVIGEGAAIMVLERERGARKRGAHVYAEVSGGALTSSAHHVVAPDPDGDGLRRAMVLALGSSGTQPNEVDVVFAHGLGSPVGDAAETKAIKAAFGAHARRLAVPAIKSMLGNCLGASGAIASLAAVHSICHGVVPPTTNLTNPDPECDLDYVPRVARPMKVRVAMVNGYGFGGQNVALVVKACD